jgi:hypothetical protein
MITDNPTHPPHAHQRPTSHRLHPTRPCSAKKTAHNIIAMDFSGALSPALAQAGYLYPNTPWQSNHCSTSAEIQQHDHLTFHSLPTPHHATIAHPPPLGQTSTSPGPRLPPRPTNLTLKTFSTLSLTMQTTTFNAMNAVNLKYTQALHPQYTFHPR